MRLYIGTRLGRIAGRPIYAGTSFRLHPHGTFTLAFLVVLLILALAAVQ